MATDIEAFDIPQTIAEMGIDSCGEHPQPCIEDVYYRGRNRRCGFNAVAKLKTIKPGTEFFDALANLSVRHGFSPAPAFLHSQFFSRANHRANR